VSVGAAAIGSYGRFVVCFLLAVEYVLGLSGFACLSVWFVTYVLHCYSVVGFKLRKPQTCAERSKHVAIII
jgi:hypothetical protein